MTQIADSSCEFSQFKQAPLSFTLPLNQTSQLTVDDTFRSILTLRNQSVPVTGHHVATDNSANLSSRDQTSRFPIAVDFVKPRSNLNSARDRKHGVNKLDLSLNRAKKLKTSKLNSTVQYKNPLKSENRANSIGNRTQRIRRHKKRKLRDLRMTSDEMIKDLEDCPRVQEEGSKSPHIQSILHKSLQKEKMRKIKNLIDWSNAQVEQQKRKEQISMHNRQIREENRQRFKKHAFKPKVAWGIDEKRVTGAYADEIRKNAEVIRTKRRTERDRSKSEGKARIGLDLLNQVKKELNVPLTYKNPQPIIEVMQTPKKKESKLPDPKLKKYIKLKKLRNRDLTENQLILAQHEESRRLNELRRLEAYRRIQLKKSKKRKRSAKRRRRKMENEEVDIKDLIRKRANAFLEDQPQSKQHTGQSLKPSVQDYGNRTRVQQDIQIPILNIANPATNQISNQNSQIISDFESVSHRHQKMQFNFQDEDSSVSSNDLQADLAEIQEIAAIIIQRAFRNYLARKIEMAKSLDSFDDFFKDEDEEVQHILSNKKEDPEDESEEHMVQEEGNKIQQILLLQQYLHNEQMTALEVLRQKDLQNIQQILLSIPSSDPEELFSAFEELIDVRYYNLASLISENIKATQGIIYGEEEESEEEQEAYAHHPEEEDIESDEDIIIRPKSDEMITRRFQEFQPIQEQLDSSPMFTGKVQSISPLQFESTPNAHQIDTEHTNDFMFDIGSHSEAETFHKQSNEFFEISKVFNSYYVIQKLLIAPILVELPPSVNLSLEQVCSFEISDITYSVNTSLENANESDLFPQLLSLSYNNQKQDGYLRFEENSPDSPDESADDIRKNLPARPSAPINELDSDDDEESNSPQLPLQINDSQQSARLAQMVADEALKLLLDDDVLRPSPKSIPTLPPLDLDSIKERSEGFGHEKLTISTEPRILTDQNAVLKCANDIFSHARMYKYQILNNLSTPLHLSPRQELARMQMLELNTLEHTSPPEILPQFLYQDLEKNSGDLSRNTLSPTTRQALSQAGRIHNKLIFDAFNECLQKFRPYKLKGSPMPWSFTVRKAKHRVDFDQCFQDVVQQLEEWSLVQAGKIPTSDFMNLSGALDEESLHNIREERLSTMLAFDVLNNDEVWIDYEWEESQVVLDLADMILEALAQDCVSILDNC